MRYRRGKWGVASSYLPLRIYMIVIDKSNQRHEKQAETVRLVGNVVAMKNRLANDGEKDISYYRIPTSDFAPQKKSTAR